jgi:conjugative relaxase-like TrwC/TraI family protein
MAAMLRVTTLRAAGTAVANLIDYYAGLAEDQQRRDGHSRGPVDYYLDPDEPPGRWWGTGSPAVGLEGEVEADQLRLMLEARHPSTGRVLGRGFGDKSARGFDATFSASKSVSVLWALSPDPWVRAEVLAAHDTAVTAALSWLERHGAVTRRGTDGVDQVDTQGLVVALFRQHTSRSVDPQLHTHALIWSKVQDPTGRWLALDARWLSYQQRSIGWVYDAALRAELTARLGVAWDPVTDGHADIAGIGADLRELFSQRTAQVEAKLATYVRRWADEHAGAEPDRRTVARLQRWAVIDSRPDKEHGRDADDQRVEWIDRARCAGFEPLALPTGDRHLPGVGSWDREGVIQEALTRVAAQSSTWLRADLAREIASLVPADAAASAAELVDLVDDLAEDGASRCEELHPPPQRGIARRSDGRPITEHVVDRRMTTRSILAQERRLLDWARAAVAEPGAQTAPVHAPGLDAVQLEAARAVARTAELVLVVGPAGAGKTTMLAAAVRSLAAQDRPVLGLAPSGKAADVLGREAGCPAITVAKLLAHSDRPGGIPAAGMTLVLDEAGMASTEDLDRLVALAQHHHWRLACVGDPYQLPAVGRGGMFAHWCDTLHAIRLEDVRRFAEAWEAEASLLLRAGNPRAVEVYAARRRLKATHPALVAERVAREYKALAANGATVAITTSSAARAREVNEAIQHHQRNWRRGPSVRLRDGTRVWAGDRIATRRNDPSLVAIAGSSVRNRQSWTVTAVGADGSLRVSDPDRGEVSLPAEYVARHVELGWAVTGYGNQGVTVDHGICVVEPTTSRAGLYVGMTRGRRHNAAWVLDAAGTDDPAETLLSIIRRPASAETAHAVRDRLHGHAVTDVSVEAQRLRNRLDRLQEGEGHRGPSRPRGATIR